METICAQSTRTAVEGGQLFAAGPLGRGNTPGFSPSAAAACSPSSNKQDSDQGSGL